MQEHMLEFLVIKLVRANKWSEIEIEHVAEHDSRV